MLVFNLSATACLMMRLFVRRIYILLKRVRTLVAAYALEANAAVAGPGYVVTGGVVHTLTELLAAITKPPGGTLCTRGSIRTV